MVKLYALKRSHNLHKLVLRGSNSWSKGSSVRTSVSTAIITVNIKDRGALSAAPDSSGAYYVGIWNKQRSTDLCQNTQLELFLSHDQGSHKQTLLFSCFTLRKTAASFGYICAEADLLTFEKNNIGITNSSVQVNP